MGHRALRTRRRTPRGDRIFFHAERIPHRVGIERVQRDRETCRRRKRNRPRCRARRPPLCEADKEIVPDLDPAVLEQWRKAGLIPRHVTGLRLQRAVAREVAEGKRHVKWVLLRREAYRVMVRALEWVIDSAETCEPILVPIALRAGDEGVGRIGQLAPTQNIVVMVSLKPEMGAAMRGPRRPSRACASTSTHQHVSAREIGAFLPSASEDA
jgi:hypothetical protein